MTKLNEYKLSSSGPRKARRRFHRAFFNWVYANCSRFMTPSFRFTVCTDRFITFTIDGLNPALSFGLLTYDLGVHVDWQGENWDSLIFFESCPLRVSEGYNYCLCEDTPLTIYPSREALWVDHVFEPFLKWVNEELTQQNWLSIDGASGYITSAHLGIKPDPDAVINMPVWLESL